MISLDVGICGSRCFGFAGSLGHVPGVVLVVVAGSCLVLLTVSTNLAYRFGGVGGRLLWRFYAGAGAYHLDHSGDSRQLVA